MKQPYNDEELRARFQAAVDHGLSGLTGDPALARRVLNQAKGEKPKMKRKFPVALAAAIILVSLCTAALAVGVMRSYREISWKGEVLQEEVAEPLVTPTPRPEPTPDDREAALNEHVNELVNSAADGEAVFVFTTEEDKMRPRCGRQLVRSVPTMEALKEAIEASAPWLPLPSGLPEGFAAREINLFYDCYAGHDYTLLSEEQFSDGLVVRRYGLGEADGFISGYWIDCRDAQGHIAGIDVNLIGPSEDADYAVGLTEDQSFEALSVPGMDDALYIASEGHAALLARVALEDAIEYRELLGPEEHAPEAFREVHVSIFADSALTKEEMLAIFE